MYPTPGGDRILDGAERELFTHSLSMIVDLLADGDMEFGVTPFEELQRNQKLVVLYNAACALLRPNVPTPKLTAFIESAVATIYEFVKEQVNEEIDNPEPSGETSFWRRLVREASLERVQFDELPDLTCPEKEAWAWLLECLAGCVLWDNDYELQHSLDLPPDESRRFRNLLGMADDYYTDVPHDPPDNQVQLYLDALMGLTSSVR